VTDGRDPIGKTIGRNAQRRLFCIRVISVCHASIVEIRFDARRPDLQNIMRTMNVTLSDVGDRKTDVPELRTPDMTLRARTYRFRAYSQFTEARKVLLP
jgi:hypothetical protein